ncbi:MAG: HU family DNA-binding protein [Eubacteriaceae bacterium]|nr:HU family DNA-binding protein [Eubacteriaceae bacterium]
MNKPELMQIIAQKTSCDVKDVDKILRAFTRTVAETLNQGEKVTLSGFGTFEAKKRSSREGVNPRTGERIVIPDTITAGFKAGKRLKDIINGR